ncbi:S-adenosyl-L-methionine-dependent methyltransferase [Xylariaceae sp. FL0016]|nr:S-adenosyl-L-methionine-dependent methyltransferase [Xylariaceae sp. FL0016]
MSSSQSVVSSEPSTAGTGSSSNRKWNTPPSFVSEAQRTLLYFRAVDADSPEPVLGDIYAKQLINKVDLGVVDTMGRDLRYVKFWCLRSKRVDTWCQQFMDEHAPPHGHGECTVINLSCGLDTRVQRISPPAHVHWIDIDHGDVIAFRTRVYPPPTGDYRMMAIDISEPDFLWVKTLPNDQPTLVIAESNMYYFQPDVSRGIVFHVADHFPRGQLCFDVLGTLTARLINMKMATVQKKTGMKILWAIDDPHRVLEIHPKLRFLEEMRYSNDMPPWFGELKTKFLRMLPAYRNLGRVILLGLDGQPVDKEGGDGSVGTSAASTSTQDPDSYFFKPLPALPDSEFSGSRPSTSYSIMPPRR